MDNPPTPLFDAIIDCVGASSDLYSKSSAYLVSNGVYAQTAPGGKDTLSALSTAVKTQGHAMRPKCLGGINSRFVRLSGQNSKADLQNLQALIAEGACSCL